MFHFHMNGVICHCDTVSELQSAINGSKPGVEVDMKIRGLKDEWFGNAGDDLNKALAEKAAAAPYVEAMASDTPKKHRRSRKVILEAALRKTKKGLGIVKKGTPRRIGKKLGRTDLNQLRAVKKGTPRTIRKPADELKSLPLVKGGITWQVTKRIGKKLGRTDLNQLRTDLFSRKLLDK
jgi:hypothetical protein